MAAAGSGAAGGEPAPLRERLQALTDTWRALTETRLGIFAIEARRAGRSLAGLIACAVAAACVAAATWLMLCIAGLWWAIDRGTEPAVAVGVAIVANVLFVVVLALIGRACTRHIRFEHTRRALGAPKGGHERYR